MASGLLPICAILMSMLACGCGSGQPRQARQPTLQEAKWSYQEKYFENASSSAKQGEPQLWADRYGKSQPVPRERAEDLEKRRKPTSDEAASGGYKKNDNSVKAEDISSPEWEGRDPQTGSSTREW